MISSEQLNLTDYERFRRVAIHTAFHLFEGEKVLSRHAFRWHLDGEVIPNGFEQYDMSTICRNRFEIVVKYTDDLAIVKEETVK